jgi:hypothetical protein
MPGAAALVGLTIGKVLVIDVDPTDKNKCICRCECGNVRSMRADVLSRGIKSCGCVRSKPPLCITHGKSHTRTYRIWQGLMQRCYNKSSVAYRRYGANGIIADTRWSNFESFLEDMGETPHKHSIDRIDGNKGYSKENCRWVTQKIQARNTSNPTTNTSGHKGISYRTDKNRWEAYIGVDNRRIRIGYFKTLNAAINARKEAEIKYWGEYYSGLYVSKNLPNDTKSAP